MVELQRWWDADSGKEELIKRNVRTVVVSVTEDSMMFTYMRCGNSGAKI